MFGANKLPYSSVPKIIGVLIGYADNWIKPNQKDFNFYLNR